MTLEAHTRMAPHDAEYYVGSLNTIGLQAFEKFHKRITYRHVRRTMHVAWSGLTRGFRREESELASRTRALDRLEEREDVTPRTCRRMPTRGEETSCVFFREIS